MKRGDILITKGNGRAGSNIFNSPFHLIIGGGVRVAVADVIKIVWRNLAFGCDEDFSHRIRSRDSLLVAKSIDRLRRHADQGGECHLRKIVLFYVRRYLHILHCVGFYFFMSTEKSHTLTSYKKNFPVVNFKYERCRTKKCHI